MQSHAALISPSPNGSDSQDKILVPSWSLVTPLATKKLHHCLARLVPGLITQESVATPRINFRVELTGTHISVTSFSIRLRQAQALSLFPEVLSLSSGLHSAVSTVMHPAMCTAKDRRWIRHIP